MKTYEQKIERSAGLPGGVSSVSIIQHDLKNSLGVLVLLLDLSRHAGNEVATARQLAQTGQVIARLRAQLDAAAAELAGRPAPVTERLAADRVVNYVAANFAATLPPTVRLVLEVTVGLPAVALGAVEFERLLANLLINAGQALPPAGGVLRVTAHRAADGQAVVVSVADTGVGMAPEMVARLGEATVTTRPEGHGVGWLSVVHLVRQAGGGLAVESAPGVGTCVTVTLPGMGEIGNR